uniref:snRNA-activating protein complex subunit 4 n=1 Tax=Phlebotomus papatasi TaxID=29031 RepID=A0A1B0DKC1_PHLPP
GTIDLSDSDDDCFTIDLNEIGGSLLNEAKDLIVKHDDITPYNAMQLNQRYIKYLEILRKKVQSLIELCDKRYNKIDEIFQNRKALSTEPKRNAKWQSVRCYGYPFFKTQTGKKAPENEDHIARKARGEMVPLDFVYMKKKNWTLLDQKDILDGVKSNMITFHNQRVQRAIRVLQRRRKHPNRLGKIESLEKEAENVSSMSFPELWECVKDCEDFKVDWDLVSLRIGSRHQPNECEAMWRLHLNPELRRGFWLTEEEDDLLNAVEEFGENAWDKVASKVGKRSEFQCFVHYQANFGIMARIEFKKKFTPEEDEKILELVEKYRFGDSICWTRVGSEFVTRTKHTLYKRYQYTLKPNINHDRFTVEDDCVLMAAIEEYGTNFSKIVKEVMPNRTVPQLRSRYKNSLMFVGNNNIWTVDEDEALMSCRTRYVTIKKFLEANPRKTVQDVPRKFRRLTTTVTRDNWKQKIVELQQNKSEIDEDPLREASVIDKKFFKLFLTTYDYHFGEELKPQRTIKNNLFHISKILDMRVTKCQVDAVKDNFSENQLKHIRSITERSFPKELEFWKTLCLPVSWSTIVAFRGIAATLAFEKPVSKTAMISTNVPEVREFKERFRKMFYWTALLSRLAHPVTQSNDAEVQEENDPEASCSTTLPQEATIIPDDLNNLEYVIEYSGDEYVIKQVSPKKDTASKRDVEV